MSDRSVIGEQYVNLIPPNDNAPYLKGGEIIPMQPHVDPAVGRDAADQHGLAGQLGRHRTRCARPCPSWARRSTTAAPISAACSTRNSDLLTAAEQNLPQTIALIEQSSGVLQTQLDERDPIASWAHSLNLLSEQLKKSDPDIRRLLDTGPSSLGVVRKFVQDNRTDLGVTLANLATIGTIMVRHRDGIEEVFELYPALAAGGQSVIRRRPAGAHGRARPGDPDDPRDCGDPKKGSEGYQGTVLRSPSDLTPAAPNVAAHCSAPGEQRRQRARRRPTSRAAIRSAHPVAAWPILAGSRTTPSSRRYAARTGPASWATRRGWPILTAALH